MTSLVIAVPVLHTCSIRHFPLSHDTFDAQLFCDDHGRLLPDNQRSRVRVCGDVGRGDGQVRDFESLDSVDVQSRVDDAT